MPVTRTAPAAKKTASPRAKKAALPTFTFESDFDKETKNTVRLVEEVADPANTVVGPLYIQKGALGDVKPSRIRVTIEVLAAQSE
jgi:hypothetical protein